jgi:TonB family protein
MISILVAGLMVVQAAANPVPTGACMHEATIVKRAQPIYPPQLPAGTRATAVVAILVSSKGSVEKASIYRSSGYRAADAAALKAAEATTYAPRVIKCKRVEGELLYPVEFVPGPAP